MPLAPDAGLAALTYALVYALLLVLPGLALLSLLGPRIHDPLLALGLGTGLGIAIQPLLFLWAHVLGVTLGPLAISAFVLASAAIVVSDAVRRRRAATRLADVGHVEEAEDAQYVANARGVEGLADAADAEDVEDVQDDAAAAGGQAPAADSRAPWLAVGAVFLVVFAARLWAVQDVSVPLWGDSMHHTMIVRLLASGGGLVDDWRPLAPLSSFTYHYGLHAGVTSLVWLSGLPEHRALLLAGQVLSALQVLTAYALVAGLTRRPWAGVGAALAVGGLSPMPAYYVNWGRYTQLAGQVALPATALLAVWAASRGARPLGQRFSVVPAASDLRIGALAAISVAGLVLTHYLVALVFCLFALAWLLVGAGPIDRRGLAARARSLARLGAVAAAALCLSAPWLARLWDSIIARAAVEMVTGGLADADVYGVVSPLQVWERFSLLVGTGLVVVVALAAVWGLARRERTVWLGLAWAALLLVAAYPGLLGLPVTPPLKDFTVAIGLYLPASLIVGGAMGDVMAAVEMAKPAAAWAALGVVAILAAGLAWKDRNPVVDEHVLVTRSDERAMTWLREETPTDAVFLVSCLKAFGNTVCAGDDAGWWIPLLAERRTTVPPITYGVETTYDSDYVARTNRLADLWHKDLDAPATRQAMDEAGVTHAYLGAKGSELDRGLLASSPNWSLVYDRDGVQVFSRSVDGGAP